MTSLEIPIDGSPAVLLPAQISHLIHVVSVIFFLHRCAGGVVAGISWGNPESSVKILCLHGWMDNAASALKMCSFSSEPSLL